MINSVANNTKKPVLLSHRFKFTLKVIFVLAILASIITGISRIFYLHHIPPFFTELLNIDLNPGLHKQDITRQYIDAFKANDESEVLAMFEKYGFKKVDTRQGRVLYVASTRIWTFSVLCGNRIEVDIDFFESKVKKVTKHIEQTCL